MAVEVALIVWVLYGHVYAHAQMALLVFWFSIPVGSCLAQVEKLAYRCVYWD
jgi:hypothetical protein